MKQILRDLAVGFVASLLAAIAFQVLTRMK